MDVDLLQQQLVAHIEALEREGYVDNYFKGCFGLKKTSGITFVVDLIATFCTDTDAVLDNMTNITEYPIVDYNRLHELAIKLKGSSACIGACRISANCTQLVHAIVRRSKGDCQQVVNNLKIEKSTWETKMENIMQVACYFEWMPWVPSWELSSNFVVFKKIVGM